MIPVDDALNMVLDVCSPLQVVDVPILAKEGHARAVGSVLAEDVVAPIEHPHFDTAISDGYGLRSVESGRELQVAFSVLAGHRPERELKNGECCYVATGAPLPKGADAVCKEEDVRLAGNGTLVWVPSLVKGKDVRRAGSDHEKGAVLVARGSEIRPWDCGLAASIGKTSILVHRRPRVCILSTGDELIDALAAAEGGGGHFDPSCQVYDANRASLLSLVDNEGAIANDGGLIRDNFEALKAAVSRAALENDIVVTTGGASVGRADLAKRVLEELRATFKFGRLHMKPGKPTTFAVLPSGSVYFGLPGNPVSAIVTAQLLLVPAIRKLMGKTNCLSPQVSCRLAESVSLDPIRPEYRRVMLTQRGHTWLAHSTGFQRSSRLISMKGADALALVPESSKAEANPLPAGTLVPAVLLGSLPSPHAFASTLVAELGALVAANNPGSIIDAARRSDLVLVYGGISLAPTDTTVAHVKAVCDRPVPGLSFVMARALGDPLQQPYAALRDTTLVLALPANPSQARHCLDAVRPLLWGCKHEALTDLEQPFKNLDSKDTRHT